MDYSIFESDRSTIKDYCAAEEEAVSFIERFTKWHQDVMVLEASAGTKVAIFGSMLGLSEIYWDYGMFTECIEITRKSETLFYEILEEVEELDFDFVIMLADGYSRHGLDSDARRVANRCLEIIKRKYSTMNKAKASKLMRLWKEDFFTIIDRRQKRRSESLMFIRSLANAIPKTGYPSNWSKIGALSHRVIFDETSPLKDQFRAVLADSSSDVR